jgi:hypothetical protein
LAKGNRRNAVTNRVTVGSVQWGTDEARTARYQELYLQILLGLYLREYTIPITNGGQPPRLGGET